MRWKDPDTGKEYHLYLTDDLAADLSSWRDSACEHAHQELRIVRIKGGSTAIRRQCQNCGARVGNPVPKRDAPPDTKEEDTKLRDVYEARRRSEYNEIFRRHVALQKKDHTSLEALHAEYLKTPKWQALRAKVLNRAKGICEGCGEKPATEVHHLTYDHWRDELLFELVAVCRDCHAKCHPAEDDETAALEVEDDIAIDDELTTDWEEFSPKQIS